MSACINSFSGGGTQYSNCVCAGIIYLVFSFVSDNLQARFLGKPLLSASLVQTQALGRAITKSPKPLSTGTVRKLENI